MSLTVVLAVGLDSWLLATHSTVWRSEGYIVIAADSKQEAIDQFKGGDFDLVLLGDSIALENKKRLAFMIRASGSQTPVISIADSSANGDAFADATLNDDAGALLKGMGELIAAKAKPPRPQAILYGNAS
jgi:DNA-binding response OmpR family regulator